MIIRIFLALLSIMLTACLDENSGVDQSAFQSADGDSDELSVDVLAPVLVEVTAIESTSNLFPRYTFNSTERGRFTWVDGECRFHNSHAEAGDNTLEIYGVAVGEHSNCAFTLTDASGNQSEALVLSSFTVLSSDSDSDGFADFSEVEYGTNPFDANSSPMGILSEAVNFSDDNDSDGFSDELEAWFFTDPNHPASKPIDKNNDLIPDNFDASNDTGDPRLLGFDILESDVNIETGNETITFNLSVVDDISGLGDVTVNLFSENGHSITKSISGDSLERLIHNLSLQSSEFGAFAESGTWEVTVTLVDKEGNSEFYRSGDMERMEFDSSISVVNPNADTEAPELLDFSILNDVLNIEDGNKTVSFSLAVADDLSGISSVRVSLINESGTEVRSTSLPGPELGGLTQSLTLQSTAFHEFSEAGIWKIRWVSIRDLAGNIRDYNADNLEAMDFESSVVVNN